MRLATANCAIASLIGLAGCESGEPRQISSSGFGAFEVSLAVKDSGAAVAWYDTRDGNAEIYLQSLDESAREIGPDIRLTSTRDNSYEVDIDPFQDGFAVAWYEMNPGGETNAMLAFWQPGSGFAWQTGVSAAEGGTRIPAIRGFGDRVFCAWVEKISEAQLAVRAGWWDVNGRQIGRPIEVGPASETTWNLNVAIDSGGIPFVAYDAVSETEADEIYVARIGDDVSLTRITPDDGFQSKFPDLAFTGNRAAVTWFDNRNGNNEVYLFVGDQSDLEQEIERRAYRVTHSEGDSIGAYLAWNGERLGLSWSDDATGSYEIYFQGFDASGSPKGPAPRISTSAADSLIPSIRSWGDGYALAWNEFAVSDSGADDPVDVSEVKFTIVD